MINLIQKALDYAEAQGFAVSIHPTNTAIVKNFREYLTLAPMESQVAWSVREPMVLVRKDGFATTYEELEAVIGELR